MEQEQKQRVGAGTGSKGRSRSRNDVSPKGAFVLLFLDLETTGTSVGRCRVVELAAAQAFDQPGLPGACFAEVVRVPSEVLQSPEAQAAAVVHGISNHDIETSQTFELNLFNDF